MSSLAAPETFTCTTSPGRGAAGTNDTVSGRCPCERALVPPEQQTTINAIVAVIAGKRRESIVKWDDITA